MIAWLKRLIPDRSLHALVLGGPFRGARIFLNPRSSTRKILGIYEHELNAWLASALRRVDRVLDVGANDGYFSVGCAAAFRRIRGHGEIVAFEPDDTSCALLEKSAQPYQSDKIRIRTIRKLAGSESSEHMSRLDSLTWQMGEANARQGVLLKIDVEGAEEDVLDGAASFIVPGNLFVIEVHREAFIATITERFARHGLRLLLVRQRPHFLLGRELRSEENYWLVSDLNQAKNAA